MDFFFQDLYIYLRGRVDKERRWGKTERSSIYYWSIVQMTTVGWHYRQRLNPLHHSAILRTEHLNAFLLVYPLFMFACLDIGFLDVLLCIGFLGKQGSLLHLL